ncbi:MAG: CARDB domain-containing protein [bacterium]|nr:CARDB domain-containing protein [bacterium]
MDRTRKILYLSLLCVLISCSAFAEQAGPALVIEGIGFSAVQPLVSNKEVLINFSVRNPGSLPVSAEMVTVVIEEGKPRTTGYRKLYKEFLLSPLAAGEKKVFELAYTPNAVKAMNGSVEIKLKTILPVVQTASFTIIPEKKPDFRIVRLELEPLKQLYETGETITFRPVWSADEGRLSPCNLKFFIDGRETQDISYEVYLPVKENRDTAIKYVFTQPGEHTIKVVINRDSALGEINSTNNEKATTFTVESILPDLTLAKMELAAMPPVAGTVNKIKYTIANIGLGASTPCILELLVLEDNKETSRLYEDIPKIPSQGSYNNEVSYTFGATAKRMRIVGILDRDKALQEVSRDNNQTFIRSNIDQPARLAAVALSEEEQRKNTKAITEILEKLKQAEKTKSIDDYMVAYSTECVIDDPTVKSIDFETYKLRINDIFRQYDDIKRIYAISNPIVFAGPDSATLTYTYKIDGIFRELKILDTISAGELILTFKKEQGTWKILKQEAIK